jgi:hypothetical protein
MADDGRLAGSLIRADWEPTSEAKSSKELNTLSQFIAGVLLRC